MAHVLLKLMRRLKNVPASDQWYSEKWSIVQVKVINSTVKSDQ